MDTPETDTPEKGSTPLLATIGTAIWRLTEAAREFAVIRFGASYPASVEHGPNGERFALVRDGFKLQKLEPRTRVLPGHTFDDLDTYAAWLTRHAEPTTTEILVGRLGTERSCSVTAWLAGLDTDVSVDTHLRPHPRFAHWLGFLGRQLSQQAAFRAIVSADKRDFSSVFDQDRKYIGTQREQIAAELRKLDVKSGGTFSAEVDETGVTRAVAATKDNTTTAKLPPSITVSVPILAGVRQVRDGGLIEYDVDVDLEVLIRIEVGANNAPVVTFDCPGLEIALAEAQAAVRSHLQAALGGEYLVGLGELGVETVTADAAADLRRWNRAQGHPTRSPVQAT